MTTQAIFGLGVPELLIILAVILLLFGGSRLAGLGKSTGRALKEFKEETKGLSAKDESARTVDPTLQSPVDRPGNGAPGEWPPQSTTSNQSNPSVQPNRPDPTISDVRRDV